MRGSALAVIAVCTVGLALTAAAGAQDDPAATTPPVAATEAEAPATTAEADATTATAPAEPPRTETTATESADVAAARQALRSGQTDTPTASVVIEGASNTPTANVTPNDAAATGAGPTQSAPADDLTQRSIKFSQGREGVIVLAAKYVLPAATVRELAKKGEHGMTAGGLIVTATLPAGLTYVRHTSVYEHDAVSDRKMACAASGQTVTCRIVSTDPAVAAVTESARTMRIMMVVRAAQDLVKLNPGDKTDVSHLLGDVTAKVDVTSVSGALSDDDAVPAVATWGVVPPKLSTTLRQVSNRGHKRVFELTFHNIGGLPAVPVGRNPAIWISEVLPHRDPHVPFSIEGKGWSCDERTERSAEPTVCTTRDRLPLGAASEPLTVTWYPLVYRKKSERETLYEWDLDTKASWTTIVKDGPRAKPRRTGGQRCQKHPYRWRLHHLTPARLDVHVLAAKGIDLRQGDTRTIVARIGNIGQDPAKGLALRIRTPRGVSVATANPKWTCKAEDGVTRCAAPALTLPGGKRTTLALQVSAADEAPAERGHFHITPYADGARNGVARGVPIAIKDVGDPEATPTLQFQRQNGSWRPWRNGAVTKVVVDRPLTYRVQIANEGGNVIPPETRVHLTQSVGTGVVVAKAEAVSGGSCTAKPLACVFKSTAAIAPGQPVGTVEITVVPRRVAKTVALGPVTTTVDGEPGSERVPLLVRAVANDDVLRVTTHIKRIPDVGGLGDVNLRVANLLPKGKAVEGIVVTAPLPRGVVIDEVVGTGWTCTATADGASCAYAPALAGRTATPPAKIRLRAGARAQATAKPTGLTWRATARGVSTGHREFGVAKLALPIRKAITITATASPRSLAAAKNPRKLRSVILTGSESTGNGVSLDYRWEQRCTTAADVAALSACPTGDPAPRVRVTTPTAAVARAHIPGVSERTTFVFQLTITDGSSTKTKLVRVTAAAASKLAQRTEAKREASGAATAKRRAAQKAAQQADERARQQTAKQSASKARATQASGASRAKAAVNGAATVAPGGSSLVLGAPGAEQQLSVKIVKGPGPHTIRWRQVSGTATEIRDATSPTATVKLPAAHGVVAYTATVTSPGGRESVSQITVSVGPTTIGPSTTPQYCSLAKSVAPGRTTSLGTGVSATFGRVSAPPAATTQACRGGAGARAAVRQSTSGSFSNSSFTVGSLTIAQASGSYSPAGVEITAGTLQLPADWNMAPISVGTTPLSLVFPGNGAATQLSGSVTTPTFAFVDLPDGWSGSTTLTFAPGDNGTTTGTAALSALDGNGGTATLTGSFTTGGTFTLSATADNLVTVGGEPLDLSGQISNATGDVVSTITGAIAKPITLASGVRLTTLTTTWQGGDAATPAAGAAGGASGQAAAAAPTPAVTGQAVVAIQSGSETPTALAANLAYTSTTDWSVTLTASGGPTWTPLPGLAVQPSDFSGQIGQANGAWQWDLKAQVASWSPTPVLTLTNLELDLSNSCSSTVLICPKASMFILVSLNANLAPPVISPIAATATAVLGLGGQPGFSLYAGLTQDLVIIPGAVELGQPSMAVNYGFPDSVTLPTTGMPTFSGASDGGWNVNVLGDLSVPGMGSFSNIAANFSKAGISLGGWDPNGISLGGSSNGAQSGTAFGWASFASTMTANLPSFGSSSIQLTPNMFSVQGGFTAPDWWDQMTKPSTPLGLALGTIQFDPTTGFFNGRVQMPGNNLSIPSGGSTLGVSSLFFDIQFNTTGLTVSAGGIANLGVKALGGGQQSAPTLMFEISYDIATNSLSGTLEFEDATGWNDAFGVDGLVIDDLAISLGITLDPPIPLPTIGLYASGDLPPSLMQAFGVDNGVPISMTAELSETSPCLAIAVGSSTGTTPIMDVGDGALTASYFEFAVAPDGCTVGTSTIPAGMSLAFDGAVFGTVVDVSASLSLDPTIFVASLEVGAFSIPGTGGSMTFQETVIDVSLNEATNTDSVSFSGGFSMFGTTIDVAGSLVKTTNSVDAALTLSQPQPLVVEGFELSNLMIVVNVEYGPGEENLSVAAAGDMNIMGTQLDVSFDATIDNGVVEQVDVSATLQNLTLGPATMNGSFQGTYSAAQSEFDVNANVTLTVEGFSMAAQLEISPQCVGFTGDLQVGSTFSAQLAGTMIYQNGCTVPVVNAAGQSVTGAPGDFSFGASNVDLAIAGFDVTGDVGVGSVGGDFYASVAAAVDLSPQGSADMISVQGEFQSNGNFSFTGQGQLELAGFDLDLAVAVSNQNGNEAISGSAEISLLGSTIDVAGDFTLIDGQPSTTLSATVDLNFGGFNAADAVVNLSQTPTSIGLAATIDMNVDVASIAGTITFVEANGAPALYYLSADGTLDIGIASATLNAILTNCTDSTCATAASATTLTMNGDMAIGGVSFNFPTISISSNGDFSVQSSSSGSACTGTLTIPLITQLQGCFAYTENLYISNQAPYFSTTDTASLQINGDLWDFTAGPEECCCRVCWWFGRDCTELCIPEGGWTAWSTIVSISAGIEFTADPFSLGIEWGGHWYEI